LASADFSVNKQSADCTGDNAFAGDVGTEALDVRIRDRPESNRGIGCAEQEDLHMAGTKSFLGEELSKFYEAWWLDLPIAAAKSLLTNNNDEELTKAGWKAYDAWISLSNELTNQLYSNPAVGEITGQAIESVLRWRQMTGAMASAFFGNLWPAMELPTRGELTKLRDELVELRAALAAYIAADASSGDGNDPITDEKLRLIWKAVGERRALVADSAQPRKPQGGKRSAAA
jgi:hypothetical protein